MERILPEQFTFEEYGFFVDRGIVKVWIPAYYGLGKKSVKITGISWAELWDAYLTGSDFWDVIDEFVAPIIDNMLND